MESAGVLKPVGDDPEQRQHGDQRVGDDERAGDPLRERRRLDDGMGLVAALIAPSPG